MSLITKSFGPHKEYMIDQGGLTHAQAKTRTKELHKNGVQARIAPYEGEWATWIRFNMPAEGTTPMISQLTCLRCGYKWFPRKPNAPAHCPKCKSPYWNKPRRNVNKEEKA